MRSITIPELNALEKCRRAPILTNDGGSEDEALVNLCEYPTIKAPLVQWEKNPTFYRTGYISRYTLTERGLKLINSRRPLVDA